MKRNCILNWIVIQTIFGRAAIIFLLNIEQFSGKKRQEVFASALCTGIETPLA